MTTKRMVYEGWSQELAVAVDQADETTAESFTRADVIEGTTAFAEKRPPRFERLKFGSS